MSWLLSVYGDEDDPGEQVNTYSSLAPRIIDNAFTEQISNAEYVSILENAPRNVIDPTPEGLDPLKVAGGIAAAGAVVAGTYYGAKAIGSGLNFGYNKLRNKMSPEQKVKEDEKVKN